MKRIVAVLCLLALLLCGCEASGDDYNIIGSSVVSRSEREGRIEDDIERIDGVAEAVVVIRGNTALIGLVIKRGFENSSSEIKDMASFAAKLADVNIKSTAVTCNREINDMIKNLKQLER